MDFFLFWEYKSYIRINFIKNTVKEKHGSSDDNENMGVKINDRNYFFSMKISVLLVLEKETKVIFKWT